MNTSSLPPQLQHSTRPTMTRRLRSAQSNITEVVSPSHPTETNIPTPPVQYIPSTSTNATTSKIKFISPGRVRLPRLGAEEIRILRAKQRRLQQSAPGTANLAAEYSPHVANALASTLIFAQHEAGTAVCIDPQGWIVTCAHCFGETETEWRADRRKWLLYYTGLAVQVECQAWDARRDLALAKIICIEREQSSPIFDGAPRFASVPLASTTRSTRIPIVCIGQPGADDLESVSPRKTEYGLVEISVGRLRGMVAGADPQDNSEIGTLMHDAWTYWGHSGAPLLSQAEGGLVGLHSSWDDMTAMRHGIPLIAIREFLTEHLPSPNISLSSSPDSMNEIIVIEDSD